jgi:hypothetical protein
MRHGGDPAPGAILGALRLRLPGPNELLFIPPAWMSTPASTGAVARTRSAAVPASLRA